MRVVVITSCTGKKATTAENQLTLADFEAHHRETDQVEDGGKQPTYLRNVEFILGQKGLLRPAEEMYAGEQHVRLMRGVRALRAAGAQVDVFIVSAGYGLIPGERVIAPYEATFRGMGGIEAAQWALDLGISAAFHTTMEQPFDLGLVLLGDDYLRAVGYSRRSTEVGGTTVFLCSQKAAMKMREEYPPGASAGGRVRWIVLGVDEAKEYHCGLVGLKGEVAAQLLERVAQEVKP